MADIFELIFCYDKSLYFDVTEIRSQVCQEQYSNTGSDSDPAPNRRQATMLKSDCLVNWDVITFDKQVIILTDAYMGIRLSDILIDRTL